MQLSSLSWAFQMPPVVKNSPANKEDVKDAGLIPGLGRSSGEGKGYPLQYSSLENSKDSPWGCKESNTTERLSLSLSLSSILAWKIPWTEEPGRLYSVGSHRVRHD